MTTPKILAFSGSIRNGSINQRLVTIAAKYAEQAGAEVTVANLADYQMPLYCPDWENENGMPEEVIAFKDLMKSHNGFLIASPEYNGSLTGILKNTIDWMSRPYKDDPRMACFNGKIVGIMAASPGGLGGLRGLHHLRVILASIGTFVLPNQVAVGNAGTNLVDDETVKDDNLNNAVQNQAQELARVIRGLH
ncbi:MAG: NAD(P)H-dependent oxidoreductase [Planctomycetota bacterium]|nr:NAD(P)H-dependent oxidoreductase [Planctomycetota bacterium]